MRIRIRPAALAALALVVASCTDHGPTAPDFSPAPRLAIGVMPPAVRISEIHYDNAGTDTGEGVELSGPLGASFAGYKVVPYNGADGKAYGAVTVGAAHVPASCATRTVVFVPVVGLQNGSPDGVALVDPSGKVIELLSYEGTFTVIDGPVVADPAASRTTVDIGVSETGSAAEPAGLSLQRDYRGRWTGPVAATAGRCNDETPPIGPVTSVTVAPARATLAVGGAQRLVASAFDAEGDEDLAATAAWTSSAPEIATVDAAGLVTAVSAGDATITVEVNGVQAQTELHVTPADAPRIVELHYDNTGADVGEAIEIDGPVGTELDGWTLVLYDGGSGAKYATKTLAGNLPNMCAGRGVLSVAIAGIQNGPADGVALVDPAGKVVELLSYEGSFTAKDGPAAGMAAADIKVAEGDATPAGTSLKRDAAGVWQGTSPASFGACNGETTPPPSDATIAITELMGDPVNAESASWGEWFEVHNYGAAPVDLQGWTILSNGQASHTIAASVVVAPGGYAVLGRGADPARNGGVALDYNYFTGATTIWLDGNDWLELREPSGVRVDYVVWTSLPKGVTRAVRDVAADNENADGANWGYSTVPFGAGDFGTPRAANGTLADTPPVLPNRIAFSGRIVAGADADPPLPVGFQDQLFATERDGSNTVVPTTIAWSAETPELASVDQNGVVTALGAGTAVVRATALDGTTATFALPTREATASTTAQYAGNAEFGEPADADASDDFIVRRPQYTLSYNKNRGTPNWVSYEIDVSHFGPEDRCDCFTFDPALPADFARYTTADYTGAGTFHGYGIDRGHLARSFDRTAGSLDNATTFYFSNIIPQAADLNQGPWAVMENYLGDLARSQSREVYVVAGVAGSKGTVKDQGKITIPERVWKVAVVMPRDQGLASVHSYADVEVVAVIMPNDPGVRNVSWESYKTTVDAVEALSGYDLLALLRDDIEIAVESGTRPPVAALDGPYDAPEGSAVAMSAAASSDADGDALTYAWSFGDGATAAGVAVTHTYAQDGSYAVRLIVTDGRTLADTVTTTATVRNVAPAIDPFAGATLLPGETYAAGGTFADPGADGWTGTVDYGDGSGTSALALAGGQFSLSHVYEAADTFTVTVRITDDDATSTRTQQVVVLAPVQAVDGALLLVDDLLGGGGALTAGNVNSLRAKLEAARAQLERGNSTPAAGQLGALLQEVDALVRSGRVPSARVAPLQTLVQRVVRSITR